MKNDDDNNDGGTHSTRSMNNYKYYYHINNDNGNNNTNGLCNCKIKFLQIISGPLRQRIRSHPRKQILFRRFSVLNSFQIMKC